MTSPPPDLRSLLARTADGDRAAFAALYDAVAADVYGLVRSVVASASTAADITAGVFLDLRRTAGGSRLARQNPWAFIMAATHSSVAAHVRAQEGIAEPPAPPDAAAALAGLPPLERQALLLTFWGCRTYREAASRLEVSAEALNAALRAGLRSVAASSVAS